MMILDKNSRDVGAVSNSRDVGAVSNLPILACSVRQ
jgi:hypothetical protein